MTKASSHSISAPAAAPLSTSRGQGVCRAGELDLGEASSMLSQERWHPARPDLGDPMSISRKWIGEGERGEGRKRREKAAASMPFFLHGQAKRDRLPFRWISKEAWGAWKRNKVESERGWRKEDGGRRLPRCFPLRLTDGFYTSCFTRLGKFPGNFAPPIIIILQFEY